METKDELLHVWREWLPPDSRWLRALADVPSDIYFREWGGGLPGRKFSLLPFCMEAFRDGESLGAIERLLDLHALAHP